LEIAGRPPLYSAEYRRSESGSDILVPSGGGFASVPKKDRWLTPPILLSAWGAEAGWVGFLIFATQVQMTYGDAATLTAELVVTAARGGQARAVVASFAGARP
jgi:hypothetical protein